ncbi:MAG: Gfo/Idh/MocA family oxidoreductase [Lentisphaeria bacterium]|nr:Gfo/Idh/MocA family oxidoreductase [Lentisphaeria bacterium]
MKEIRIAVIGMDTSHAVQLPKLMQDPESEFKISGMRVTRAMRFETPFQNKAGLDEREAYLRSIGVEVTEDFEYAIGDCDAIMLEINDPSLHLEYFEKVAALGKPVFLDKPFADTVANTRKIIEIGKKYNTRYFTASSLRFTVGPNNLVDSKINVNSAYAWGPLGQAAAGSSIVWYGVHTFEQIERIMGIGAESVTAVPSGKGVVCVVKYKDGRGAVVELNNDKWVYGDVIRDDAGNDAMCSVPAKTPFYYSLMEQIRLFFLDIETPVSIEDSFEVMALCEAADKSFASGKPEAVEQL